mgnify:CR=1 FL=1
MWLDQDIMVPLWMNIYDDPSFFLKKKVKRTIDHELALYKPLECRQHGISDECTPRLTSLNLLQGVFSS